MCTVCVPRPQRLGREGSEPAVDRSRLVRKSAEGVRKLDYTRLREISRHRQKARVRGRRSAALVDMVRAKDMKQDVYAPCSREHKKRGRFKNRQMW